MDTERNENTPNLEELMQLGIQSARHGNKPNARVIFQQVLDADKRNERAWLWMAAVAETPIDRVRYLRTVLQLNPNNSTAQRELKKLEKKQRVGNSKALLVGTIGLLIVLAIIVVALIIALSM
ncbi:MAG: hypothetical protein GXY36_15095 [Chloroflexi bacterium]|nr:hypothetical protein [Chloroflexota bacterium]